MHVVITGASAGIGAALARAFARQGADLTLVARRRALLETLATEVGARCHIVDKDLSESATADDFLPAAVAAFGDVDILVNNAGYQLVGSAAKLTADDTEKMLALNLLTPFRLTRAVLPAMIARGAGTIVDVSSMAALAPVPGMVGYNASKAGLAAGSESLRGELRKTGVHVLTVYPGPVDTDLGRRGNEGYAPSWGVKVQPWGTPEGLAKRVLKAIEKKKPRVVYPEVYGPVRHLPGITRFLVDRLTPPTRDV